MVKRRVGQRIDLNLKVTSKELFLDFNSSNRVLLMLSTVDSQCRSKAAWRSPVSLEFFSWLALLQYSSDTTAHAKETGGELRL